MNYTSQLKGWATDRVIEMYKAMIKTDESGKEINPITIDRLIADAGKLADFAYSVDEDIATTQSKLIELEEVKARQDALSLVPASNKEAA